MRKFILSFEMAPGDVLMLTALVRDLKLLYGNSVQVDVRTNFPAIWRHNPYLTSLDDKDKSVKKIAMMYDPNDGNTQRMHFVTAFHKDFEKKTGLKVPCLLPRADLHLTDIEKAEPNISGRYWIIIPGGKLDMTNKFWSQVRYQQVVDKLLPYGINCVQEGAVKKLCVHPPLDNVLNIVGTTSVRDLIVNIQHAEGVICGVTFPMHAAAALNKPCVVIGGGRESPWWEEYSNEWNAFGGYNVPVSVPHRFLHTLGRLPCCKQHGCGKKRVVALGDGTKHDFSLCERPMIGEEEQSVPECMDMISSDDVVKSVLWYYDHGYLLPPTWKLEGENRGCREPIKH